jgi:DNA-binding transcriptional LysR family regulator
MPAVPPLHLLAAFEACARHASFARAADELGITPSAVSHRIRDLEESFGEALFVRRGRRVELTIAGARYLADVRDALERLARLARPKLGDRRRERLRIASPPTFARQLLAPRLAAFGRAHPAIDLELSLSIPFSDVKASDSDVEIRFGDGRFSGVKAEKLFDETLFPVASAAYARTLAPGGGITPRDIASATLLRNPRDAWRDWFAAAGLDVPEPRDGPLFNDLGLLVEAAAQGQGVALARSRLAHAWLESRAVVRLSPIESASLNAYYVVVTEASAGRPAVRAFVDWIRSGIF